jgi:quercetin dioxygenase-like cupin family protein
MFGIKSEKRYKEILPGINIKTLCHGEHTLMTEFILTKNSVLPEHSHPYEQTGYLVKGKIKLFLDGNSREITPGESWCIKKDIKHKAEIIEDSVALEIFSPVREDYLQFVNKDDIVSF